MPSNFQIAAYIINQIKIINRKVLFRMVARLKTILIQKIPKIMVITLS